jgi:16S rRNA (guanine966-N2)-methyltransferase
MPRRPSGAPSASRRSAAAGPNELRIIGGEWRGRRIRFPETPGGIRPTPDRVRETLFNWLQNRVAGARALDLFAGSGALGLEALSRGAREVVFVDSDRAATRAIGEALVVLECERGRVLAMDARQYLRGPPEPFDLVFLDPPYASGDLEALCRVLVEGGWLRPDARVYLEQPASHGEPGLPPGLRMLRSKRAGEVGYHLAGKVDD